MSGMWRLIVRSEFSAAHALRHYKGKCENPHGHNFVVETAVEGCQLDAATGMLVDFGILKKALAAILSRLDHADLNVTPPFDSLNPSSEQLAQYIGGQMEAFLAQCPQAANVRLCWASVSEKNTQTAVWLPCRQQEAGSGIPHVEVDKC